jgi:predicted DCC family thiol-disulfide oxidoreductase YuxK
MAADDPAPGKGIVLYDGDCPLCRRSVAVLKKLDWRGRLAFQNARDVEHLPPARVELQPRRLLEEMHVLTPDRQHAYAGYRAFRWMAWRLPLTMPLAPLLYVPGVPWVGNKVYLWVARNRFQLVPCHDGQCQVPLKPRNPHGR